MGRKYELPATSTAESINPVPQFTTWIPAHKNYMDETLGARQN